jgi:hypothetical protein
LLTFQFPFDETGLGCSAAGVSFTDDAGDDDLDLEEMQELNVHAEEFVPVPTPEAAAKPVEYGYIDDPHESPYLCSQNEPQERCLRPPPGYGALPSGGATAFQNQTDVSFVGEPIPAQDSGQNLENEQSSNSRYAKSYERRNKKKRPPGYYNQLECYRTRENSLQGDEKVPSDLRASAQERSNSRETIPITSQQTACVQKPPSHVRSSDSVTIDIEIDDDSEYSNEPGNLEYGVSDMTIENSNFEPRTEQPVSDDVNKFNTDDNSIFESNVTKNVDQLIEDTVHKMVPQSSDINIQNIEKATCNDKPSEETIQTAHVDWFDADEIVSVSKPETSQIPTNSPVDDIADKECRLSKSENTMPPVETKESSPAPVPPPAAKQTPAQKPTSWAGLFKNTTPSQPARGPVPFVGQANQDEQTATRDVQKENLDKIETVSPEDDKTAKQIGSKFFQQYGACARPKFLLATRAFF